MEENREGNILSRDDPLPSVCKRSVLRTGGGQLSLLFICHGHLGNAVVLYLVARAAGCSSLFSVGFAVLAPCGHAVRPSVGLVFICQPVRQPSCSTLLLPEQAESVLAEEVP